MFALLASETASTTSNVSFDGTITISIILAICALFAPSITARINNKHQYKMRKLELDYDLKKHRSDILYKDKYDAFKEFLDGMNDYSFDSIFNESFRNEIFSLIHKVKLQCNSDTLELLEKLQTLLDSPNRSGSFSYSGNELNEILTEIASAFNQELSRLLVEPDNKRK